METLNMKVGGMTCEGCVASVKRVLEALPGVTAVDVSLARGAATIRYEPNALQREQLKAAVEDAGFDASF